jgi:hypothetical protein
MNKGGIEMIVITPDFKGHKDNAPKAEKKSATKSKK